MATTPNFANTPHNETGTATTAVTGLGSGAPTNIVPIFTATVATNIVRITAQPVATTVTATAAYLFISKPATPTVRGLKDSVTVPAQTVAATAGITKSYFADYSEATPLRLGAGEALYGGIGSNQTGIVFNVETADF